MTQLFDEEGRAIPVTLIQAGPCMITQIKTKEKDGYQAVQLGFDQAKKLKKPQEGHLKKCQASKKEFKKLKYLREFRIEDPQVLKSLKLGEEIKVDVFEKDDLVDISGISKAKGFAGVVKRYGFATHPGSHGHPHQRRPGSIGSMYPQRVFKGKKMPGRMGGERVTLKNLQIIKVDPENNLLWVKGGVPGIKGGLLEIKWTGKKAKKRLVEEKPLEKEEKKEKKEEKEAKESQKEEKQPKEEDKVNKNTQK